MAGGGAFTASGRLPRQIVTEDNYAKGMQHTDIPLPEGYCKTLVNFDFKDNGATLVPRSGMRTLANHQMYKAQAQALHHTGQGLVRNTETDEDASANYTLFLPDNPDSDLADFMQGATLVEEDFSPDFNGQHVLSSIPHKVTQTTGVNDSYLIRRKPRPEVQMLHDIPLTDPDTFKSRRYLPIRAALNGMTFLPVQYTPYGGTAVSGLAKLQLQTADGQTRYSKLEYVSPKDVSPTEALNYGYNMLKQYPYSFSDASTTAGIIILEGILPYTGPDCTQVKFNAKVGERITFRLFAQFPDTTTQYKFRWEFREIGTDNVTVYEDQAITNNLYQFDGSKAVNKGVTPNTDFICLTVQPPYKQFSVTVKAYVATALADSVAVIALASYSLAGDNGSSAGNIEPRTYPLHTATDMCAWRQRIVLWGVQSAPNMIFISDLNDPSYFPYPNNCEIYEEAVIACIPYLGNLLVFTESRIYKVAWNEDGLSFTSEMIQDKLSLSAFDRETITLVQNLVFFKNGNYFYMIVPRAAASSQAGTLQLAPISTPVTYLLDHFQAQVREMVFTLYNPNDANYFPRRLADTSYDIRIQDYHNYLDGAQIRNIYKYELVLLNAAGVVSDVVLRFDFQLNYDTLTRAWSCAIMQANDARLQPYRQSVTDMTIFMSWRNSYNSTLAQYLFEVDFIKPDQNNRQDLFPIEETTLVKERLFRNHQLLDTGNREHNTTYKKRYREVQFRVNATGEESLQFGTAFMIDDQVRKELFDYEVSHVTDPDSPDYGWIYIEQTFANPLNAPGATLLEDPANPSEPYVPTTQIVPSDSIVVQSNRWILDASQLAHTVSNKLRLKVSGKGYMPRLILVSFNDRYYELLNYAWVFRMMSAR